jgi:Zn-dependent M28 family amino/carboxypeptidase
VDLARWRGTIFGVGEPRLYPLAPRLRSATDGILADVQIRRLRSDVVSLPGPRGRLHAPEAMVETETMIVAGLRDAGWQAERRPYTLHHVPGNLDHGTYRRVVYPELGGVNIVAVKRGETLDEAIVVAAHYDTVPGSPGADDNGSGVAALLELARVLAPYRFRRSVVLAALDMEEIGLIGARALLPQLHREQTIKGAVVFESIAYTSKLSGSQSVPPGMAVLYRGQMARLQGRGVAGDFTATIYNGPAVTLARCIGEGLSHIAGEESSLLLRDPNDIPVLGPILGRLVPSVRNFSRSDHVLFWRAGIPAVLLTDTADFRNPHYHRASDTPDTLDYERLGAVVGATALTLARTAGLVGSGSP